MKDEKFDEKPRPNQEEPDFHQPQSISFPEESSGNLLKKYFGKPLCMLITILCPPLMIYLRFKADGMFRAKYQLLWSVGLSVLTIILFAALLHPLLAGTITLFFTTWILSSLASMAGSLIGYQIGNNIQIFQSKKMWSTPPIALSLIITIGIVFAPIYLNLLPLTSSIALIALTIMIISPICMAGFRYFVFKGISQRFQKMGLSNTKLDPYLRIKKGMLIEWKLMLGYEHARYIFPPSKDPTLLRYSTRSRLNQGDSQSEHSKIQQPSQQKEAAETTLHVKEIKIDENQQYLRAMSPITHQPLLSDVTYQSRLPLLSNKEKDIRTGFFTASTSRLLLLLLGLTTLTFIFLALPPIAAMISPSVLPNLGFSVIMGIAAALCGMATLMFYKMIEREENERYPKILYAPISDTYQSYLFKRVGPAYGKVYYEKVGIEISKSDGHSKIIRKDAKKEDTYEMLTLTSLNKVIKRESFSELALETSNILPYNFSITSLHKIRDTLNTQNMMLDGSLNSLEIQNENLWRACKRKFLEMCRFSTPPQKLAQIFLNSKGNLHVEIYESSLNTKPSKTYPDIDRQAAKIRLINLGFNSKKVQALEGFGRYRAHTLQFKPGRNEAITIELADGKVATVTKDKDKKVSITPPSTYTSTGRTISRSSNSKTTPSQSSKDNKQSPSTQNFDFSARMGYQPPPSSPPRTTQVTFLPPTPVSPPDQRRPSNITVPPTPGMKIDVDADDERSPNNTHSLERDASFFPTGTTPEK